MNIKDSVVVITGASSGIGRATAEAFAREGACLVLASRREWALREVEKVCQALGARTYVAVADVTREDQVQGLAQQAFDYFGRLDVWVNNAGVGLYGRFEDTPSDVYHRVMETNFFGCVNGARAALPLFRKQGHGILVNLSSVTSGMTIPFMSAYSASKAAVRSFGECLRMELNLEKARDVHVCTVMPSTTDTNFFQNAANYTGRATQAMPPVMAAEQVARAIVQLVRRPRREVVVGTVGRLIMAEATLVPGFYEKTAARLWEKGQLQNTPAERSPGNVFEPGERISIDGQWQRPILPANRRTVSAGLAAAGAAALGVAGIVVFRKRRSLAAHQKIAAEPAEN